MAAPMAVPIAAPTPRAISAGIAMKTSPRWIWALAGVTLFVAALAGWLLARKLGGETAAEAEVRHEPTPVAAAN